MPPAALPTSASQPAPAPAPAPKSTPPAAEAKPAAPPRPTLAELDSHNNDFAILAERAIEVASPQEAEILRRVNDLLSAGKFQAPVLPDTHLRVMEIANKPSASAAEIADCIKTDAVVATEVMSLVNSAAYMPATPIRDLTRAVVHVGVKQVRGLMFGVAMRLSVFRKADAVRAKQLWLHSLGAAVMAREIAKTSRVEPEEAFLAALLHDIGKTVILGLVADEEKRHPGVRIPDPLLWRILEEAHTAVGVRVADAWRLAPHLRQPIEMHHRVQPDSPPLVAVVSLTDDVCRKLGIGVPVLPVKFSEHPAFTALRLGRDQAHELVSRLPAVLNESPDFQAASMLSQRPVGAR
jgi:putative nucleotidyltransferase with HDIG domain